MAHVNIEHPDLTFDEPVLLDGLPGQGLIGKLVADHVVGEFDMEYYASVYCEGVPPVAAYRTDDSTVRSPVQIYAAADHDLLALVSDVPVSPSDSPDFAECITGWLDEQGVVPIFLSGLSAAFEPDEGNRLREVSGLSTGDGDALLEKAGLAPPRHTGIVTGPTGALLNHASDVGLDSVGLLVQSNDELPDYDAARTVIDEGIGPIVDIEIDTSPFADRSFEMSRLAESALERGERATEESTRARPTPTFY